MPAPSRLPPPADAAAPPAAPSPRPAATRSTGEVGRATPADADGSAAPARGRAARLRGRALGLTAAGLFLLAAVGLLLRVTVKDGVAPLAWLFYALSVPSLFVVAAAGTLAAAMAWGLRLTIKRVLLLAALGLIGGALAAVLLFPDSTFDDRPRVVLWNTARGAAGWPGVADALEEDAPALAVLIESGTDDAAAAFWRERFGEQFFLAQPGSGVTVLSRGPLGRVEPVELPGGGVAVVVRAQVGGERVSVIAVDLPPDPFKDRGAPLRAVAELAAASAAQRPTLVAGDFNTPPDSVHFGPLRRAGFHHTFERHGSGYAATWPVPAPVLHLDHVWLSPGFDVGEVSHGWSAHSDHRPVFVPTRVSPKQFAAARSAAEADDAPTAERP